MSQVAVKKKTIIALLFITVYMPTFLWMGERWCAPNSYFGHGVLVPLVTAFLIWRKKDTLTKIKTESSPWGLRLITLGILTHLFSAFFQIYFSSGFSMFIVIIGLILHFYGKQILREILFPVFFLLFMFPLPMLAIAKISFTLKLMAAKIATFVLNHLHIPAFQDGTLIKMRHTIVVVEDACSGLRSLMALIALGSLFAYEMKSNMARKVILVTAAIPIAVLMNAFRIVFLAMVSEIWGPAYTTGSLHNLSGILVFALAFMLLFAVKGILEK